MRRNFLTELKIKQLLTEYYNRILALEWIIYMKYISLYACTYACVHMWELNVL